MKRLPVAIFSLLLVLLISHVTTQVAKAESVTEDTTSSVYQLDLNKWRVYNDGTHPVETTRGLNAALVWASQNHYTTFVVPNGTYTIDKNSQINMVSNMTFLLEENAVIQKESNGLASYKLLQALPGVENIVLKGGTYKGDKDIHNYSSGGTHEGGYGLMLQGAKNVTIDGVKAVNFTGDGLCICTGNSLIKDLYKNAFVSGSVDPNGELIADRTKVRVENLKIEHPYFKSERTFQFIHQRNLPASAYSYVAYFYKADGTFISKVDTAKTNTPVGWGSTPIPNGAAYMNVVFNTSSVPTNVYVEYVVQAVSKNVTVQNSEFAFNRRQGITVGGAQDVLIQNNKIHDMKGTAPQSGIDLEAGYNLNNRITVKNNEFYNNQAYDLILYDGRNATVDGNNFSSKSIGLAISEPFKYATIKNNTFNGARIYAYNYATFKNNKMNDALATFLGNNLVIDGFEFQDTLVNLASSTPYGIQASNITVKNTKKMHTQFGINVNPIRIDNLTITGAAAIDSISGNASNGSVFNNVKVIGFTRVNMPRGTFNNCVFEAATDTNYGGFEINNTGNYEFNNCTFKSTKGGFDINSIHGVPDSVIIKNSKIDVLKDNSAAISVQAGKKVSIVGNTINAGAFPYNTLAAVKVGNYWYRDQLTKVTNLTVDGNVITTKGTSFGISTIHAGKNAPSYSIKNNTLYNGKLDLKANDVNLNNIIRN